MSKSIRQGRTIGEAIEQARIQCTDTKLKSVLNALSEGFSYRNIHQALIPHQALVPQTVIALLSQGHQTGLIDVGMKRASDLILFLVKPSTATYRNHNVSKEAHLFFVSLSTLTNFGCSIMESLEALTKDAKGQMYPRIRQIMKDMSSGFPLSEALNKHQDLFPPLLISKLPDFEKKKKLDKGLSELTKELLG